MRWAYSTLALGASPGLSCFLQRRRDRRPEGRPQWKSLATDPHWGTLTRIRSGWSEGISGSHNLALAGGTFPQTPPHPAVLDGAFAV